MHAIPLCRLLSPPPDRLQSVFSARRGMQTPAARVGRRPGELWRVMSVSVQDEYIQPCILEEELLRYLQCEDTLSFTVAGLQQWNQQICCFF